MVSDDPVVDESSPTTRLIPWGASDGEVGNVDPGGGFLCETPASIVDDGDATWIVDRANQRVTRTQSDGTFHAVPFPVDVYLGDIVLMTGTPYLAVLGSTAEHGYPFMTTFLIDR